MRKQAVFANAVDMKLKLLFIMMLWGRFVFADTQSQVVRSDDDFVTEYVLPTRVVWKSDSTGMYIQNEEQLLQNFLGQVSVNNRRALKMKRPKGGKVTSILLDFGKELQGGVELALAMRPYAKPVEISLCFGESVSEALSSVSGVTSTATNDHAMRNFNLSVPWLGTMEVGNTGFRFLRIDLVDQEVDLELNAVRAVFKYRDIPYLGSFESDNEKLNKIWKTGAYTVHLNMQNYLWDGIKRDRLVWLGDLHPEVMTVMSVFGAHSVVNKTLDFAKTDTPLPGWINGMSSYSLWWLIIQRDLYLYTGNLSYLKDQKEYFANLIKQVCSKVVAGKEELDGVRFLDWPTSECPDVIHSGLQSLTMLALEAGVDVAGWVKDPQMKEQCERVLKSMRSVNVDPHGNKQALALNVIASSKPDNRELAQQIALGGAHGFSTFYGYYMLEALAKESSFQQALDIIMTYWGGMLDLGATTFWEDVTYEDMSKATPIDQLVPEGAFDIHAQGGAYCYKGHRHSLCHGWASGPTAWLSRYVLGVKVLEPGCKKVLIEPNLGNLKWVKGTFPTPYGEIKIEHVKTSRGVVKSKVTGPKSINIIIKK